MFKDLQVEIADIIAKRAVIDPSSAVTPFIENVDELALLILQRINEVKSSSRS